MSRFGGVRLVPCGARFKGRWCRFRSVVLAVLLAIGIAAPAMAQQGLVVSRTTVEALDEPLGLDAPRPRLSWTLASASGKRGARQAAFHVLAASTADRLARDQGDLWDSGRVESGQSLLVEYGGRALASRQQVHWKVRVWDEEGRRSAWSRPASWTMGLLARSDWKGAWIGSGTPRPPLPDPATLRIGHASTPALSSEDPETVVVDLGGVTTIDGVQLYPARRFVVGPWIVHDTGYLFPRRFRVDVSLSPGFEEATTVVDRTAADEPNPGIVAPRFDFPATDARFVRLTVTRLRTFEARTHGFALAELAVWRSGQNVAHGASVTASRPLSGTGWSPAYLTDGRTRSESPYPEHPVTMLRREFSAPKAVRRATLYATALGLYEVRLNGEQVDGRRLAPEWTSYESHVQYQVYDVTSQVRRGANVVAALLAEGWYAGRVLTQPKVPTVAPRLLAQLELEFVDGSTQLVVTDDQWRSLDDGPIRFAGIYDGEVVDRRKAVRGWDASGVPSGAWAAVTVEPIGESPRLVAQVSPPIRVLEERRPVDVHATSPGVYVFDFGQNVVGGLRLRVRGRSGEELLLRPAERLNPDGTPFFNLKGGTSAVRYTFAGDDDPDEVYESTFTYFGFRYVEARGFGAPPSADALTALVFNTASATTGSFSSSDPRLDRLMDAIGWTIRGNLMGVPTDCPQRDERLGWMGDVQAAADTLPMFMDVQAPLARWFRDVRAAQDADGRFGDMSPQVFGAGAFYGSPGWGDTGVIVPWAVYVHYGDRRVIEESYPAAVRWVDWVTRSAPDLIWRATGPGDWLNGDRVFFDTYPRSGGAVAHELFATAFFAHSTDLVARMASVLGRTEDVAKYRALHARIKEAFAKAFVGDDGLVQGDTQAGYTLALHFGLVPEAARARALARMVEALKPYDGHLSTGIQATHRLMLELSRGGRHDVAMSLLARRTPPSWGYMLDKGATTIWERWDGWVDGRDTQPDWMGWMNSFNHVAFGAVGEWVWREVVGLAPDEQAPGYERFRVAPRPGYGLSVVNARFASPRGDIGVSWSNTGKSFSLRVDVPVNSVATVVLPATDPMGVRESGTQLESAGCRGGARVVAEGVACEVGSGRYEFTMPSERVAGAGQKSNDQGKEE